MTAIILHHLKRVTSVICLRTTFARIYGWKFGTFGRQLVEAKSLGVCIAAKKQGKLGQRGDAQHFIRQLQGAALVGTIDPDTPGITPIHNGRNGVHLQIVSHVEAAGRGLPQPGCRLQENGFAGFVYPHFLANGQPLLGNEIAQELIDGLTYGGGVVGEDAQLQWVCF